MILRAIALRWSERQGRERIVLVAGAAGVLIVALYVFLWQPGLAATRSLAASLPTLRAQVDDMRLQQKELSALRKSVAAASHPGDARALLQAAAERSPFHKSIQRMEALSSERVLVVASPVGFDEWLRWINHLQREFGLRIERCRISSPDQAGRVRAEATFILAAVPLKSR
jgi:type II secretory pathway component PulM